MASIALFIPVPTAKAGNHLTSAVVAMWDRVAQCETGGVLGHPLWDWGKYASSNDPHHRSGEGYRYEGGVGFASTTWQVWAKELHLFTRFRHAYQAPRMIQIKVAQYGLVVHRGYWGCLH